MLITASKSILIGRTVSSPPFTIALESTAFVHMISRLTYSYPSLMLAASYSHQYP